MSLLLSPEPSSLTQGPPPPTSTQPLSPSKVETPVETQWKVSSSF